MYEAVPWGLSSSFSLGQSESQRHGPAYKQHVPLDDGDAPRGWPPVPGLMSLARPPAPLIPSSTRGQGKGGHRNAESVEIGLLDGGQRLRELALALDFEHHHRRK